MRDIVCCILYYVVILFSRAAKQRNIAIILESHAPLPLSPANQGIPFGLWANRNA